ncbi:MAG: efflux RND transporter periplasmic adaptor subunit [Pseudomonadota bacterium]|nr:efflux RND transporter periplasmic adaptor subunit [Pseudomonadota bacterium]
MVTEKSTKSNIRLYALAAAAASTGAIGLGAVHFAQPRASTTNGAAAPHAVNVTVSVPTSKKITEWDEYTGRFQAIDSVEVRARVSGYLTEVAFTDGDIVEQGDLLFRIDPRPFQAELDAAEANLASADAAYQNAKAEQERGGRLVERQALSKEEADRRVRALLQAQAQRAAAKAHVDEAKLNVEFTEVRAPIAGRISDNFVSDGNLIVGGAQGGTLLTRIVSLDPIYFEFTASEAAYLKYVRLDQQRQRASSRNAANPVFVKLIDESSFAHEGRMSFVDNQLDPSTGTMRGRATFDNADGVFIPGMFGHLQLVASGEYEALMIPDSAVQTDQHEKFVWIASDNDTAERRRIEPGPIAEGLRVVRSGLAADTRVIVGGSQFVAAGTPLSISQEEPEQTVQANIQ